MYGVEIKSPESTNHVKYIINGGIPKDYMAQVLRPFTMLPSLETIYFVSYNPEVTACPLYIYEAKRENFTDEIAKMVSQEEKLNNDVAKYVALVKQYGQALGY